MWYDGAFPLGHCKPGGVHPNNHYGKRANGGRHNQKVDGPGASDSSTRGAKKTCFSTHRACKGSVLRNCVKAKRCPTRKAGVQKAHVPRTSSRYNSSRTSRWPGWCIGTGRRRGFWSGYHGCVWSGGKAMITRSVPGGGVAGNLVASACCTRCGYGGGGQPKGQVRLGQRGFRRRHFGLHGGHPA